MAEAKPFASLTSGLLARKGAAKPAMRRQTIGGAGGDFSSFHIHDDLGWNDMGQDSARYDDPSVGLTPMPQAASPALQPITPDVQPAAPVAQPVPPVVEQIRALEERVAPPPEPVAPPAVAPAPSVQNAAHRREKTAFTLRLDPARHLRLRLACAVGNRSAQQIVTRALDDYLDRQPDIEALASQLPTGKVQ
jgi:hypothetical protein